MRAIAVSLLVVSALTSVAHAAPCEDLSTHALAEACVQAFIADPSAPPDLGASGSNMLGINHRLGDLSFILAFGRAPTAADPEALRMRTHLDLALRILSARPATSPPLAARRAAILAHLAAYRDQGTVPANVHVGRRNPVFIDDAGHICAVGYLIEQTAGRDLAETVAAHFRFAYIGDMHLPALDAWIAGSGLTAAELALIQPAYSLPPIESEWTTFVGPLRLRIHAPDGPFTVVDSWKRTTTGAWKHGHMDGHWERRDANGKVLGQGDFVAGKGTWRATHPGGNLATEGAFENDAPAGDWRAFYPDGNPALEGHFANALRAGLWTYYFDAPGRPVMARGHYRHVEIGTWEHFDRDGRHIATSDTAHGTITWYDATGVARAAEVAPKDDGSEGDGVAWSADGKHVERARIGLFGASQILHLELAHEFGQVELTFDPDGQLVRFIERETSGEMMIATFDQGTVTAAWAFARADRPEGPAKADRIATDATLARLSQEVAKKLAQAARHATGKPALVGARGAIKAIDTFLTALDKSPHGAPGAAPNELAAYLEPAPFAPIFPARAAAPVLVPPCGDTDTPETAFVCSREDWATLTDPAAQMQAAIAHTPTMITSGTNFPHLDAIASAMMAFMPDRVPEVYNADEPLPVWWTMPAYEEHEGRENNLFGQYTSSHAPMLGLR